MTAQEIFEYIERLEKALDKACEIMTDRVNIDSGNGKPTIGFAKKRMERMADE